MNQQPSSSSLDPDSGKLSPILRRGADTPAVFQLLLSLPWTLISFAVIAIIGFGSGGTFAMCVALGAFLATGALTFWKPFESLLARVLFRARPPIPSEQQALDRVWGRVTEKAGVPPDAYQLWVDDSDEVNAFAAAGHIVTVTTGSMNALDERHLEAVLAHELGHHLGAHPWTSLLAAWYSWPGRLAVKIITILARWVLAITGFFTAFFSALKGSIWGVVLGWILQLVGWAFPVLAVIGAYVVLGNINQALPLILLFPVILPIFVRKAELRADQTAADLGYGKDLIEVFEEWISEGHDVKRKERGFRANLFASHPSNAKRVIALTKYMTKKAP